MYCWGVSFCSTFMQHVDAAPCLPEWKNNAGKEVHVPPRPGSLFSTWVPHFFFFFFFRRISTWRNIMSSDFSKTKFTYSSFLSFVYTSRSIFSRLGVMRYFFREQCPISPVLLKTRLSRGGEQHAAWYRLSDESLARTYLVPCWRVFAYLMKPLAACDKRFNLSSRAHFLLLQEPGSTIVFFLGRGGCLPTNNNSQLPFSFWRGPINLYTTSFNVVF